MKERLTKDKHLFFGCLFRNPRLSFHCKVLVSPSLLIKCHNTRFTKFMKERYVFIFKSLESYNTCLVYMQSLPHQEVENLSLKL